MNALRSGWSCAWIGLSVVVTSCSGQDETPASKLPPQDGTADVGSTGVGPSATSNQLGDVASSGEKTGENTSATTGSSEQIISAGQDTGTVPTDAQCERQIEFEVIPLGEPTPFDVIIVADHSPSLTWSRDDLAAGLSNLIDQVYGGEVRFFVLTPTQYGEHSQAKSLMGDDIVDWKDPLTGEPYPNDMTTYVESCSDFTGAPLSCPSYPPPNDIEFELEGTFELRMPEPVAAISYDMTIEQLQQQQQAIADRILDLGLGGSPYEQPLCTLVRYVHQAPEVLPERAVFVVLSDEDDATSPMDCLSGVTYEQHFEPTWTTGCESNCDGNRFMVRAPYAEVTETFTCMPYDDFGIALTDAAHELTVYYDPADACAEGAVGACTPEQAASVQNFCGAGERVESCTMGCAPSEVEYPCWVDLEDQTIDACEDSFTLGGQTYTNVVDYCLKTRPLTQWAGCTREGLTLDESSNITNLRGSQCPLRFVGGTDPAMMVTEFKARAQTAFGDGNYFVEVIGLDPKFDCTVGTGQSYASNLATLASSPDDVFPICQSYAPALGRIQSYAKSSLQNEYPLPLGELETLGAVYVSDVLGNERQLSTDSYSHDFERSVLTLAPTVLASRDRNLRVEVEVHCVPPVRQVQ